MPYDEVMGKFKRGELHSGSDKGPTVKSRDQAVAIMMSEKKKAAAGKKEYQSKKYAAGGSVDDSDNDSDIKSTPTKPPRPPTKPSSDKGDDSSSSIPPPSEMRNLSPVPIPAMVNVPSSPPQVAKGGPIRKFADGGDTKGRRSPDLPTPAPRKPSGSPGFMPPDLPQRLPPPPSKPMMGPSAPPPFVRNSPPGTGTWSQDPRGNWQHAPPTGMIPGMPRGGVPSTGGPPTKYIRVTGAPGKPDVLVPDVGRPESMTQSDWGAPDTRNQPLQRTPPTPAPAPTQPPLGGATGQWKKGGEICASNAKQFKQNLAETMVNPTEPAGFAKGGEVGWKKPSWRRW